MGGDLSKAQVMHVMEIREIARRNFFYFQPSGKACQIKEKDIKKLLQYAWEHVPSYPLTGSVKSETWRKLGAVFHQAPRTPSDILATWRSVMEAIETQERPLISILPEEKTHPYSEIKFYPQNHHSEVHLSNHGHLVPSLSAPASAPAFPEGKLIKSYVKNAVEDTPGVGKSFTLIKQANGEAYGSFIDKFKVAVERQIDNPVAEEELIKKLEEDEKSVKKVSILSKLAPPSYESPTVALIDNALAASTLSEGKERDVISCEPNVQKMALGVIGTTVAQARSQGFLDVEEMAQFSVFSVTWGVNTQGQNVPNYEPIPMKVIRELKSAVVMYGITAPAKILFMWYIVLECLILYEKRLADVT